MKYKRGDRREAAAAETMQGGRNVKRNGLFRLAACAAALMLLLGCAALAYDYGYAIDVDALKALEADCPFPVVVTEKKVVEECLDTEGFGNSLDDALIFTVTNGSDAGLSAITVCFVAYDAEGNTQNVTAEGLTFTDSSAPPQINTLDKDGLTVAPGESAALSVAVDYSKFVGVRAMVARYTAEDGTVVENPQFAAWQNLAFGLSSEATTVLD